MFEESDDVKAISERNVKLSSIQQKIYITVDEKDDNTAGLSGKILINVFCCTTLYCNLFWIVFNNNLILTLT